MPTRFVRFIPSVVAVGAAVALAVPGSSVAEPSSGPPVPAVEAAIATEQVAAVPAGVERVVAGDMVVDWVDGAPDDIAHSFVSSEVPVELTVGAEEPGAHAAERRDDRPHAAARVDGEPGVAEHHAGASGGYALFSTTARWLSSGYTIRLTGADGRIEQYRDELARAARAVTATTGVPIRIAFAFGGSSDPGRGEIAVVLGSGPCGSGSAGCGGPALTAREVVSGRVWVHQSGLGLSPTQRTNLAAHELGHALGLQHFDGSWTDGRQVMYPVITGTTAFRAGDAAGLRRLAGADDRPAGAAVFHPYAAGHAPVTGTISSGSRVRISAGASAVDVAVRSGRFSGSLPLPAGRHVVCVTSLDPGPGFRPGLGCGRVDAPGVPVGKLDGLDDSIASIRVRGWAIDPQTADPVRVEIRRNGVLVATVEADEHRSDLDDRASRYGTAHGFDAGIAPEAGRNEVCVRILGVGGGGDADAGCTQIDHAGPADHASDAAPAPAVVEPVIAVVDQVLPDVVEVVAAPLPLVTPGALSQLPGWG